jgi:hypothetical protein
MLTPSMTPYPLQRSLIVVLVAISVCALSCRKKVAELDEKAHLDPTTLSKGDTITPFRYLDPDVADWKVEVRISGDDLHDVSHKLTSRKFSTTDTEVLNRVRNLRFIFGVGRPHKPSSTLRVFDGVHLYEQHGIVFEKNYLDFQSSRYGVMKCADQEEFFRILDEMD